MSRIFARTFGSLLLATLAACSQAYSSPPASQPMVVADHGQVAPVAAPYGVEVIAEDGTPLATYQHGGRFYVLGEAGQRYLVRVSNPTDRRVEAVVTVDGLDVIDGETGDLRKRGYVVPPFGEVRVEGFRQSTSEVATFRFSSVGASYAGRKGKARNVGVIAVAVFEEVAAAQIIVDEPVGPSGPSGSYDEEADDDGGDGGYYRGGAADKSAGETVAPTGGGSGGGAARGVMRPPPPPPDGDGRPDRDDVVSRQERAPDPDCCGKAKKRAGLGTEYGESRYSAASWTRFVRASDTPSALAELRYNDAVGLAALGVIVAPPVDSEELIVRETADPFPGDPTFSRPPAGIR